MRAIARRFPIGAEITPDGITREGIAPEREVHFRVWSPARRKVSVVIESSEGPREIEMEPEDAGYFSAAVPGLSAGTLYRFRLDGGEKLYPDPASRSQPQGPHGPSQVVDPTAFEWTDAEWRGVSRHGQVLYEMHVGTFTPEGTWAAAARQLPELADTGITLIEMMPVAEFSGRFGWGYDGVDLFAPCHLYGTPDDFRAFVDQAHAAGLGVILDVVYNHLGPDGNYLSQFSPSYFTSRRTTDWGEPINFDGPESGPVREFYIANAGYWIEEFHLDGLRLDATQDIFDDSQPHIVAEIAGRARRAGREARRPLLLVAENESQRVKLVRPREEGGDGLDALWNDDFHHSAMVALTGRAEAYYSDYRGTPQEFISAAKWGYLSQGQWYYWQTQRRGTPTTGISPCAFINFIQNHDQVANSARGLRAHAISSPGRYRAMTALTMLLPGTPMLFQGQEFAASTPFLYFADHGGELSRLVREGRLDFLSQFPSLSTGDVREQVWDPSAEATFRACKLDFSERERNAWACRLHRTLLRLRRDDAVFRLMSTGCGEGAVRGGAGYIDGAVLGPQAFLLRYFGGEDGDRLLVVNFGPDLPLVPCPEPMLAPPIRAGQDREWRVLWSSEDVAYGGCGTAAPDFEGWRIQGESAVVLADYEPLLRLRERRPPPKTKGPVEQPGNPI